MQDHGVLSSQLHSIHSPPSMPQFLLVSMIANDNVATGSIIMMHMKHIFDWDDLSMGQYFYTYENTTADAYMLTFVSYFLSISSDEASAALKPFLDDAEEFGQSVGQQFNEVNINNGLTEVDDVVGLNLVLGSRLIPASAYHDHPDTFGHVYTQLLDAGTAM